MLGFLLLGAAEEGGREGGREKPLSSLPPSALRLSSSLLPPVNAVHSRGGEVVATGEGGRGRPLLEKQGAGAYARVRGGLEERASERTPSLSYSLSLSRSCSCRGRTRPPLLRRCSSSSACQSVGRSVGRSRSVDGSSTRPSSASQLYNSSRHPHSWRRRKRSRFARALTRSLGVSPVSPSSRSLSLLRSSRNATWSDVCHWQSGWRPGASSEPPVME